MMNKKEYRIDYQHPFYCVQEKIMVGWWIFQKVVWITIDDFWSYDDAEELYKTLTKF